MLLRPKLTSFSQGLEDTKAKMYRLESKFARKKGGRIKTLLIISFRKGLMVLGIHPKRVISGLQVVIFIIAGLSKSREELGL